MSRIDPLGLATSADFAAAQQVLRAAYPSVFPTSASSFSVHDMGEKSQGYTDWSNNVVLNSHQYGDSNTPVNQFLAGDFLQTVAHEMLHVNQDAFDFFVSTQFRMNTPILGYFHMKIDEHADALVTHELIQRYLKTRDQLKRDTCRK